MLWAEAPEAEESVDGGCEADVDGDPCGVYRLDICLMFSSGPLKTNCGA